MNPDRARPERQGTTSVWHFPRKLGFPLGLAVVFFGTLIPYAAVHSFEFLNWDDNVYVIERPEIHQGLTSDGIYWAFTTFENANWHPLTWLSYMLEIELFGLDSRVMHLTNLGLHCLNAVLVACLLRSLTGNDTLSLVIAVFFGVHPQHAEAVAWVSERKELLCIFFGLQSMLAWQRYRISRGVHLWLSAHLLFVLSLLAKQMLVTLPFLLVVLAVCPLKSGDHVIQWKLIPQSVRAASCFFLLALVFTVCIFQAQESGEAILSGELLPIRYRLANAVQSSVFYVVQTLVPVGLNPFYQHPMHDISVSLTAFCVAVLIAAIAGVWSNRSRPGILAGALWFVGTLVPVIGLVQLGSASRADRYMYFPHIGLFLLIGSLPLFSSSRQYTKLKALTLIPAAAVFSVLTFLQAQIWHDSVSLWKACVRVDPDSYRGHDQLALALLADEQIDEALLEARIALRYPENRIVGGVYTTLGSALLFKGDTSGAIENLREAIRLRPHDFRALINLGYALHDFDLKESKRLFAEALEYSPANAEAMGNLANCEAEEGHFNRALELLQDAMKISPKDVKLKENFRLFKEAQQQGR